MDDRVHTYRWEPPAGTTVRPSGVYLLHGMGEHAGRYARLATRLAADGWRVAAHDHPGHGRSGGPRGVADPPDALVAEAAARFEAFAAETGAPSMLFGHSLGGIVATELVLGRRLPVAGLVLSAPAIVPRVRRRDRLLLGLLSAVRPTLALERPYDASLLTSDPDEIAAAEADPLIHGYKSAGLVRWLLDGAGRAIERAGTLDVDTLLLIAGDDALIDTARTREFAERAPAGRLTVHVHDGHRHELLNETPARRERVTDDIVRWLRATAR